jgi:hypothetical protein
MKSLKSKIDATVCTLAKDTIIMQMYDGDDNVKLSSASSNRATDEQAINHDETTSSNSAESGFNTNDDNVSVNSAPPMDEIILKVNTSLKSPATLDLGMSTAITAQCKKSNISTSSSDDYDNDSHDHNCSIRTKSKIQKFIAKYVCFLCYCCKITNTMFWSWMSIVCCCCPLLGAISLYFTHKSKQYKLKQNYFLSDKYSNYSEKLNVASIIFGILFYAFAFFIITLLLFMHWRHNNL